MPNKRVRQPHYILDGKVLYLDVDDLLAGIDGLSPQTAVRDLSAVLREWAKTVRTLKPGKKKA